LFLQEWFSLASTLSSRISLFRYKLEQETHLL
jgi:hypothetical protein